MSFFPRFAGGELAPLFRLLADDVQNASRPGFPPVQSWAPKFDVKEVKDSFQLQGELPGAEQRNIQIEFTDHHTLIIKGRTERESSSGTPPTAIEASPEATETPESRKAKVEDEDAPAPTSSTDTAVEKHTEQPIARESKSKYWVSERSFGVFHRTFTFPTRIDQDAVTASLKNGILNVVVPKSTAAASKRINIE